MKLLPLLFLFPLLVSAQCHKVFAADVATLQVVAGERWQDMPVIRLGGQERVNISFDCMTHEYRRYTYRLVHLNADWTDDGALLSTDYLAGFSEGLTIDDYEQSVGTTHDYTHYRLTIPNARCRPTMSGNYRLDVLDDNRDGEPVLAAYFMIAENAVDIGITTTDDTDIDTRRTHQQACVALNYSRLRPSDPLGQLRVVLLQNNRWCDARLLPAPTLMDQSTMRWTHGRDIIFDAGNEHHKFEMLDVHRNSLNVEAVGWDRNSDTWQVHLWPDEPRRGYVYDEVAQGAYYIRNSDNRENDTSSEYVRVHFTLASPVDMGPVYVDGLWTNGHFDDRNRMAYYPAAHEYRADIMLKYGYYSYRYVGLTADGHTTVPPTEGSFYQTRNTYQALVYYRAPTDRADRLVGVTRLD